MRFIFIILLVSVSASSHADSVKDRLTRLEQRLSSKAYMEIWQSVEQLRNEMRDLRGEIEQQSFQLQQIEQHQKQMYLDLDQRLQAIEKSATRTTIHQQPTLESEPPLINETDKLSPSDQSLSPAAPSQEDIEATKTSYNKALEILRSGRYADAAIEFEQIVTHHPNSDLADNAQYWLAETMYINRDFDLATAAFQRIISDYPDSSKVPDALLKIAFIQFEINRVNAGKKQLKELIQNHPQSSAAKLAQQRLNKKR